MFLGSPAVFKCVLVVVVVVADYRCRCGMGMGRPSGGGRDGCEAEQEGATTKAGATRESMSDPFEGKCEWSIRAVRRFVRKERRELLFLGVCCLMLQGHLRTFVFVFN